MLWINYAELINQFISVCTAVEYMLLVCKEILWIYLILFKFFTQSATIDPQAAGSFGLIVFTMIHNG